MSGKSTRREDEGRRPASGREPRAFGDAPIPGSSIPDSQPVPMLGSHPPARDVFSDPRSYDVTVSLDEATGMGVEGGKNARGTPSTGGDLKRGMVANGSDEEATLDDSEPPPRSSRAKGAIDGLGDTPSPSDRAAPRKPSPADSFPLPGVPAAKPASKGKAADLLGEMRRARREPTAIAPALAPRVDSEPDAPAPPAATKKSAGYDPEGTHTIAPRQKAKSAEAGQGPSIPRTPSRSGGASDLPPPGDRYAVILDVDGRVKIDNLIETMAAFLNCDAREARRAIRRGKGLLAVNVARSDAMVLESALAADGQPARVVRQEPALTYEPPRLAKALVPRDGDFVVRLADGSTPLAFGYEEIRLLSAGLVASATNDDAPSGIAFEVLGLHRSMRWRLWLDMPRENALAGKPSPGVREFCALLDKFSARSIRAEKTKVFESLARLELDPKRGFPDLENFENYQAWLLLANFARPA